MLAGSLLFADVSGFTALSERLAVIGPEGAERLTATMNEYFAAMLEIQGWSGGILLKFAGDAMLVYFPQQEHDQQAQWAVRAGVRMLEAISTFANIETPVETVSLNMKVGVATGQFLSASVGSERRMEYAILGKAVSETMDAEGAATGASQLIINQATADCLDKSFPLVDQSPGFFRMDLNNYHQADSFEIATEMRRARGAIPFDANPQAILEQMQEILNQIHALRPYIADELVARIIAQAQRRRFDSEFLQTTVMFCNFVGLDELLEFWGQSGVQRVTSLLSDYFRAVSDVISRQGGIVSRIDPYSKGTKLLALFGAPVSHQDDPLRAVRAALMMNVELEKINQRWSRRFSRHLPDDWEGSWIQHRIGITVGESFAGPVGSSTRREYTVMGDDVNLSARLMGAAKMGQILISQPVQETVKNYFFLTKLPPINVKGKSKPIPIYQVDGPRTDTLLNRVQQRGCLVGRDAELSQAKGLFNQTLKGEYNILTIMGPAGIGKSHLADTLLKYAASEGAQIIPYQCNAYDAQVAHTCWRGILRSLAGITSVDPYLLHQDKFHRLIEQFKLGDQQAEQLANLLGLEFVLESAQPAEGKAVDGDMLLDIVQGKGARRRGSNLDVLSQLDSQDAFSARPMGFRAPNGLSHRGQALLLTALSNILIQISEKTPLAIFFEDAHWMDVASKKIILGLQESLQSQPVFILLAQRGDRDQPVVGKKIALESLDDAGTRELVTEVLIADLTEIIYQHSQGNPLFINEIAHWVRESWQISTQDVVNALQSSDILQKLVLSSLKNLQENQRQVAQTCAVIGEQFRIGELQALLPASVDSVTLYNDLRALEEARFISLAEAGVDPRYAFQQKLVRDVLYNSLPFARRRELHAQMADYLSSSPSMRSQLHTKISAFLDSTFASSPAQEARQIARHYEAAEMWQLAVKYMLSAADHLQEQAEYGEALDTYQRALDVFGNLPSGKFLSLRKRLSLGKGDTAFLSADYALAAQNYQSVLEIEPLPDVKRKLALVLSLLDQAEEAEQIISEHVTSPDTEPDLSMAATLSWLLWRRGAKSAGDWIEKAQSVLPPDPDTWETGVEALLLDFSKKWEAAIEKYKAIDQPAGVGFASIRLGDQYLRSGEATKAEKCYQAAAEAWNDTPDGEPGLALVNYRIAEVHWLNDDGDTAWTKLNETQVLLDACPSTIRKEGRKLIVSAFEKINKRAKEPWAEWRWQSYDDEFRGRLLFRK